MRLQHKHSHCFPSLLPMFTEGAPDGGGSHVDFATHGLPQCGCYQPRRVSMYWGSWVFANSSTYFLLTTPLLFKVPRPFGEAVLTKERVDIARAQLASFAKLLEMLFTNHLHPRFLHFFTVCTHVMFFFKSPFRICVSKSQQIHGFGKLWKRNSESGRLRRGEGPHMETTKAGMFSDIFHWCLKRQGGKLSTPFKPSLRNVWLDFYRKTPTTSSL